MIVTCPACKSRHIRVGDTDYCEDCPTTAAGLKPHEVMDALRLPPVRGRSPFTDGGFLDGREFDDDYDYMDDEQTHESLTGNDYV